MWTGTKSKPYTKQAVLMELKVYYLTTGTGTNTEIKATQPPAQCAYQKWTGAAAKTTSYLFQVARSDVFNHRRGN
jgi:hypothetical protein